MLINIFFLCFAFLLTLKSHAESEAFGKAQNFFLESEKATKNYLRSGQGLEDLKPQKQFAQRNLSEDKSVFTNATTYRNPEAENKPSNAIKIKKAVYFSLLSQTINDASQNTPKYGLSLAVAIPVYSNLSYLNSEFQFSGDIKNAGDWGQIQFLQKEAFSIYRFNETIVELFFGMGFGYGHGSEIVSNQRFYAPWAAGLQWGKSNKIDPAFYRFELGWAGDFYFLNNNYSQGLLVNVSLGYKL